MNQQSDETLVKEKEDRIIQCKEEIRILLEKASILYQEINNAESFISEYYRSLGSKELK